MVLGGVAMTPLPIMAFLYSSILFTLISLTPLLLLYWLAGVMICLVKNDKLQTLDDLFGQKWQIANPWWFVLVKNDKLQTLTQQALAV
jgi:hypothetical protein